MGYGYDSKGTIRTQPGGGTRHRPGAVLVVASFGASGS